jgi:hypothetical protein
MPLDAGIICASSHKHMPKQSLTQTDDYTTEEFIAICTPVDEIRRDFLKMVTWSSGFERGRVEL